MGKLLDGIMTTLSVVSPTIGDLWFDKLANDVRKEKEREEYGISDSYSSYGTSKKNTTSRKKSSNGNKR